MPYGSKLHVHPPSCSPRYRAIQRSLPLKQNCWKRLRQNEQQNGPSVGQGHETERARGLGRETRRMRKRKMRRKRKTGAATSTSTAAAAAPPPSLPPHPLQGTAATTTATNKTASTCLRHQQTGQQHPLYLVTRFLFRQPETSPS